MAILQIKNYVSPDIRDVIFYEEIDDATFDASCHTLCSTPHPCDSNFKLVMIGSVDRRYNKRKLYYAADRQEQWRYNFTFKGTNALGGGRYQYYQRLLVIPRSDFDPADADNAAGAADPHENLNLNTAGDPIFPTGEHVLVSADQTRTNIKELDACYVFLIRTYAKLCELTHYQWDEELEEYVATDINLVPKTDLTLPPTGGIDGNGEVTEYIQKNCDWYETRKRKILDDEAKVYQTYVTYAWPAVLDSVTFFIWNRKDGQRFTVPHLTWKRRAQSLKTRAEVTRTYYATEQDLSDTVTFPAPVAMLANTVNYRCPEFTINTPACLHGSLTFVCDYGNNNPVWNLATGSTISFDPTTLNDVACTAATDWPASLIIDVQQKPYKGGYVVDVVEIFNPIVCVPAP